MYLRGTLDIRMTDGTIRSFSSNAGGQVDLAMNAGGIGVNAYVEPFAGGYLANGCPLNVYFGEPWIAGQKEALLAANKVTCPGVAQAAAQLVTSGYSPTVSPITSAPTYAPTGFTATGRAILPTGIQTPSAPIVNVTTAGPVADFGLTPSPEPAAVAAAGMDTGTMIIIGLAVFGLLTRR